MQRRKLDDSVVNVNFDVSGCTDATDCYDAAPDERQDNEEKEEIYLPRTITI